MTNTSLTSCIGLALAGPPALSLGGSGQTGDQCRLPPLVVGETHLEDVARGGTAVQVPVTRVHPETADPAFDLADADVGRSDEAPLPVDVPHPQREVAGSHEPVVHRAEELKDERVALGRLGGCQAWGGGEDMLVGVLE